ncbi:unnamed protein product, partial [marine sediment metagenome]
GRENRSGGEKVKFPADKCKCGLDLTTAEPVRVREVSEEEVIGGCPNCGQPYRMVIEPSVKTKVAVKPVLKPKVGKAKVTEKKPEPEV